MTSSLGRHAGIAYAIGDPGAAFGWGRPAEYSNWPDLAVHAADLPGMSVRAASARGRMHRYTGSPRQDGCGVSWDAGARRLVVTACDGVGSLPFSHEAADLVTRLAPSIVSAKAGDWAAIFEILTSELTAASGVLPPNAEAANRIGDVGGAVRQARHHWAATTACIADIWMSDDSKVEARLAAVGDASGWLLRDGAWRHLCGDLKIHVDDENPASAGTAALPASQVAFTSMVTTLMPGDALFLMSDGVADPLGGGGGEVGATLASWWARPPEPHEFAAQVQFERRGFQDDRTAVGVWVTATPSEEGAGA